MRDENCKGTQKPPNKLKQIQKCLTYLVKIVQRKKLNSPRISLNFLGYVPMYLLTRVLTYYLST